MPASAACEKNMNKGWKCKNKNLCCNKIYYVETNESHKDANGSNFVPLISRSWHNNVTALFNFYRIAGKQALSRIHVPFWLSHILNYLFYFYPSLCPS